MTIVEFRTAVDQLEPAVTAELKKVARASAERIAADYQVRLDRQLKAGHTGRTAASAHVIDESSHKQFVVSVTGRPDKSTNLPLWLEFGTRKMTAKPALRPAARAESDRYVAEMAKAAENAVAKTLKV